MNRLAIALITVTALASVASAVTIFMVMNGFRSHLPKPPAGANGNFPQQIFGQQQTGSSQSTPPGPPFGP